MNEGFWPIVFALGATQGVLLCVALLVRRTENRTATRLLAAIIGVFATMIFGGMVSEALADPWDDLVVYLNINTELAIGPLFLMFAHALVDPVWRLGRRDTLRFLPLPLAAVAWVAAWAYLGNADARSTFLDSSVVPLYVAFKVIWLYGHLVPMLRILEAENRDSHVRVSPTRSVRLSWLRKGMVLLSAMAALIYLTYFLGYFGVDLPFDSDPFGSFMLAVMIYIASWTVLQRPWVLSLRPRQAVAYDWGGEAARLTAHLERERPWLRPELGLGDLARAVGSTDNRISTVIREGLETNFYALVNRYRLAEFERLARDPSQRHRSVLELAYQAGFNSKASFYRVFRETHGTTPTAFRDAV